VCFYMVFKKFLVLAMFPLNALACSGYVVAFKGENDAFDSSALSEYSERVEYCSKSYSWYDEKNAVKFINSLNVPYQLYAYSKGAATVSSLLRQGKIKKPEFILTIGAYRTTNVNFEKYGIRYKNYFDHSGIGQKSPGTFLNVSHFEMQKEVNKIMR